jgi:hypothetical protein
MSSIKLFTLLHINSKEKSLHNNSFVKSFEKQIELYLSCAIQLHHSLKSVGIKLIILTNDKPLLESLKNFNGEVDIVELKFRMAVPSGIKFYSAHFKIEVFQYLSTLEEDYVGLIDSDVVCVNNIPLCFTNIIEQRVPMYYDITEQRAFAYGVNQLIEDKKKLSKEKSCGLWAGGEFISGSPQFFRKLYNEVNKIKDEYFNDFSSYHHQGDEMLSSTAIETLKIKYHEPIIDAGALQIIGRFWSPKTLHFQKSIDGYSKCFLLHLPADKRFISSLGHCDSMGKSFFKKYKRYLFLNSYKNVLHFAKPYVLSVSQTFQFSKKKRA